MKMLMLIQQAEKEGNSSSKRYKISKQSYGDASPMTDLKTVTATFHFISIEIPHGVQMNVYIYIYIYINVYTYIYECIYK